MRSVPVDRFRVIRYTRQMKKLIIVLLVCVFPILALAHPGKTDKYGGHKCVKDCEEWKLYYAEYHLHDKDGKPIRVVRKSKPPERRIRTATSGTNLPVMSEPPQTAQTVTVYQYVTIVREEKFLPFNPLLWVLLVLLLLLLILRLNRKQSENAKRRS